MNEPGIFEEYQGGKKYSTEEEAYDDMAKILCPEDYIPQQLVYKHPKEKMLSNFYQVKGKTIIFYKYKPSFKKISIKLMEMTHPKIHYMI